MSHNCGTTCKRKQTPPVPCSTCRLGGGNASGKGRKAHATPQMVGAAVDMYFDGISYRHTAENVHEYFGRETDAATVYRWVHELTRRANDVVGDFKVNTGPEWVADELQVKVGGEKYWLFNVMDSDTRYILAAYLSPERTTRAAQTVMAMARDRSANPPERIKTDGLTSYQGGVSKAFPCIRSSTSSARAFAPRSTTTCRNDCKARFVTGTRRCGRSKSVTADKTISMGWC